MRLGFVFDTPFKKYKNNFFSTNFSVDMLTERYLHSFDEMVIIGRYTDITENPTGKFVKTSSENIHFQCIRNESPLKRLFHFYRDNKFIKDALSQCDAVVCRGWRGTKICQKLNKPYLVEVVNCAWDAYWNHGLLGKIVAPIMFLIRRITTKNAPYVIYVTNGFLQKRYPTNGKWVGISDVELTHFDDSILSTRLNKIRDKCNRDKTVIGTAAAVDVPYKGHRFVIQALAKLKRMGLTNFEYQLAGKGDARKLQKLAERLGVSDQVVFKGSIVHEQILNWYDSIDIYIQPSLQEGLPRAVIEAMSRALPCYGTRTGGIPELLDQHCVCKNNRKIADQIAAFLLCANSTELENQAKRNYLEAHKYESSFLDERRRSFFQEFANQVIGVKDE